VADDNLARLVINLYETESLCLVEAEKELDEPHIICSLGLV
jgi:hypothetical protein